ncbi:hypothetical protein VTK56DRAFT_10236 [Thermocarpiscus australiensis]
MSYSIASSRLASQERADELLYGFDIRDEETRHFLSSVIASGQAPQAELQELHQVSLMRGVEEWDMLFECASALRNRSETLSRGEGERTRATERNLVPFLGAVLSGRTWEAGGCVGQTESGKEDGKGRVKERRILSVLRKGRAEKGVSHFWGDAGEASERASPRQRWPYALRVVTRCEGARRDIPVAASKPIREDNGTVDGIASVTEAQTTAQAISAGDTEALTDRNGIPPERDSAKTRATNLRDEAALVKEESEPQSEVRRASKAKGGSKSPFFGASTPVRKNQPKTEPTPPSTNRKKARPPRGTVSSLPIPPLSADRFGLIQEELADDPFRLLIAVTFLIRTAGKAAIPVFRQLMERFPSPAALAAAEPAEIIALIRPLGLSAVRCAAIQKYARMWLEKPPTRDVRYGVKNYPRPGDGRHVRAGEEFGPEDGGGCCGEDESGDAVVDAKARAVGCAWEIGHLTQGPYALDSWRIFCRDVLLGRSRHWTGKGSEPGFQPEWMRVLPKDKELRACLRWMWMREGWEWDPLTGEREPLREELRRAVDEGHVGYDDSGNLVILDQNQAAGTVG